MTQELKEKMQKAAECFAEKRRTAIGRKETGAYPPTAWFKAGAQAMYNELTPLVEWVDVKETLPQINEDVIFKTIYEGYYCGNYDGNKFWVLGNNSCLIKDKVTHWKKI